MIACVCRYLASFGLAALLVVSMLTASAAANTVLRTIGLSLEMRRLHDILYSTVIIMIRTQWEVPATTGIVKRMDWSAPRRCFS